MRARARSSPDDPDAGRRPSGERQASGGEYQADEERRGRLRARLELGVELAAHVVRVAGELEDLHALARRVAPHELEALVRVRVRVGVRVRVRIRALALAQALALALALALT